MLSRAEATTSRLPPFLQNSFSGCMTSPFSMTWDLMAPSGATNHWNSCMRMIRYFSRFMEVSLMLKHRGRIHHACYSLAQSSITSTAKSFPKLHLNSRRKTLRRFLKRQYLLAKLWLMISAIIWHLIFQKIHIKSQSTTLCYLAVESPQTSTPTKRRLQTLTSHPWKSKSYASWRKNWAKWKDLFQTLTTLGQSMPRVIGKMINLWRIQNLLNSGVSINRWRDNCRKKEKVAQISRHCSRSRLKGSALMCKLSKEVSISAKFRSVSND
jgi:hypothetical protein